MIRHLAAMRGAQGARIRSRLHRVVLAWLVMWAAAPHANAADPQPYNVTIEPSVSDPVDDLLSSSSLLATLRESAPVPPLGLIARANGDVQRLTQVLNSFGYYGATTRI